jgi:hypothetical protein
MDSAQDHSWTFYPETVLHFLDGGITVDLRFPLAEQVVASLRGLGLGPHFAVITADKPLGGSATPEENDQALARLRQVLQAARIPLLRCDGTDPSQSHRERGFACALPLQCAIALARDFRQSALFHFDGESFWLQPAAISGDRFRLPPKSCSTM